MRVVFMGTPELASVILEHLTYQHEVVGVFTRPDAVRARGSEPVASPVKQMALSKNTPVFECNSFKDDSVFQTLVDLDPEVICVAAFGVILPKKVLDLPKYGCLNVHASILPRWRGAAPVAQAILAGDDETGVSIMRMEEGLDTGAYSIVRSIEIGNLDVNELTMELADLGAVALLAALEHLELGSLGWTEQDESEVTYAHKFEKGELFVVPEDQVINAWRKVRASDESHPCRAAIAGRNASILKVAFGTEVPGEVDISKGEVRLVAKRLFLGFEDGCLELLQIKPDGKKAMDARAFAAGIQGIKQPGIRWEAI